MTIKIPLTIAVLALAAMGGGCSLNKTVSDDAKKRAAAEENGNTTPTTGGKTTAPGDPQRAVILVEGIYGDRQTKATGVIFEARSGLALTANHTIEGAPAIIATLADGTLRRARVVARAQCHDLAVLRLTPKPTGVRPIPFAPTRSVKPGAPVRTLSYALPSAESDAPQLAFTRGSVSAVNVEATFTPLPPMSPLIAHQTPLTPLGSGSPLLNEQGQLIGINTLIAHPRKDALPGIEYALSSDYIQKRLRELKPGPDGTLGGWRSEHDACHHALNQLIGAGHTHNAASQPTGAGKTAGTKTTPSHTSSTGHK
jgi:S1-C subfamily serine protease